MNLSVTLSTRRQEARELFNQLKFKASLARLARRLAGQKSGLDDFSQLRACLSPNSSYAGIQNIRLEQITGSVSRAGDFDDRFRPLKPNLVERWVANYLYIRAGHLETIRVFQVGQRYYVEDGHHRVSVGRATGMVYIQAEVWEYRLKPAAPSPSAAPPCLPRPAPAVEVCCSCTALGREV